MAIPRIQTGKGGPEMFCDLRAVTKDWFSLPLDKAAGSATCCVNLWQVTPPSLRLGFVKLGIKVMPLRQSCENEENAFKSAYLNAWHNAYDPQTSAIIFNSSKTTVWTSSNQRGESGPVGKNDKLEALDSM